MSSAPLAARQMSPEVKTCTEILGVAAGIGMTAGAAVLIASPIGAAGAATYGAISYLVGRTVQAIITNAFNINEKSPPMLKVAKHVTRLFAGIASFCADVGIANALGIKLTLKGAVVLNLASLGLCLAGVVALIAIGAIITGLVIAILKLRQA